MAVSPAELTDRLVDGLSASGYRVTLETHPRDRPVLLAIDDPAGAVALRAFIWNATPGGPAGVRREGEYRVQTTRPGNAPFFEPGATRRTILLGFHDELDVFAAWDARVHPDPGSSSSLQVALATLEEAATSGFASQERTLSSGSDEVVFAFRPERARTYLEILPAVLGSHSPGDEVRALTTAGSGDDPDFSELPADVDRQIAIREIAIRVRDARFRTRVIAAYGSKCAFCGLGAGLVDAAHIVAVGAGGPDLVANGVAACPTHHRAFDRGLITVADDLAIDVNRARLGTLGVRYEEADQLEDGMQSVLSAPGDAALRPRAEFLAEHRTRWT